MVKNYIVAIEYPNNLLFPKGALLKKIEKILSSGFDENFKTYCAEIQDSEEISRSNTTIQIENDNDVFYQTNIVKVSFPESYKNVQALLSRDDDKSVNVSFVCKNDDVLNYGDVIVCKGNDNKNKIGIFLKHGINKEIYTYISADTGNSRKVYTESDDKNNTYYKLVRLANRDERRTFYKKIGRMGYSWNDEKKVLQKKVINDD